MANIKYDRETLTLAVAQSKSVAGVLRALGLRQAGGTNSHIKRRISAFGIDTSHFTGQAHARGVVPAGRKDAHEILTKLPEGSHRAKASQLRRALIEIGREPECSSCGVGELWNGRPLVLEVDHEDGDHTNNVPSNLRFVCPNCHSQQATNAPWKFSQ